MNRNLYWLFVTLILLVAAGLRLWQIDTLPPGPHYDEAANVLITRSIAFGGANYFPIIPGYQGREALYFYLNAPLFHLIHDGRFTLQISNAFTNLLTIAASIALGRAMFSGRHGVIVGLVAGALMALSFPLILLSRQAFRAPTLPLMQALALLCLWRGLNTNKNHGSWLESVQTGGLNPLPPKKISLLVPMSQNHWLVAGGFFTGTTLYTYMASRLFPVWLLIGGLVLVAVDAGNRMRRLRQGAIFFAVLALVAVPMAIFALQNPDIFLGRLGEVTQAEQSVTLAESIRRHVRMFFIEGEQLLRYNLPGRPYFTWPEGMLLLIGLAVSLWRLLRGTHATERAAYALLLLSPLMILPSVISVGGFPPNHMRSIGMVPLVLVAIGVGVEVVLMVIGLVISPHPPAPSPSGRRGAMSVLSFLQVPLPEGEGFRVRAVIPALTLLSATMLVASTYFGWASRADLFYDTDADLAAAARWIPAHTGSGTLTYIAARDRDHPTVAIANLPDVTWLGTDTLFRPPPGNDALVIFPRSAPPPQDWAEWLAPGALDGIPLAPDGRPAFEAFRLSADTPLPAVHSPPEPMRNQSLSLVGSHANPIFAGAQGDIVTLWQVNQPPPHDDLTPIVQVEDSIGTVLGRAEVPLRGTDDWRPGEVLMHRLSVKIPTGTPPGLYPLRMTWVGRGDEQYLPYLDTQGNRQGIWATVGEVEVLRNTDFPDTESLSIPHRAGVEVAPGVRLLGWNDVPAQIRPGEDLLMTLYWQAVPVNDGRSDVPVQIVLRHDEREMILHEGIPADYPASAWIDGEIVIEHGRWPVPRDVESGVYMLVVRTDHVTTELGPVNVAGLPRQFQPPEVAQQVEITLGDALQLYGYDMSIEEGLDVLLVWHALREVDTDYTVFVHIVDETGNIVAQRDMMPVGDTYPTSLWAEGEYITDGTYIFEDLPPGTYHVRVGLYDQSTGARLSRADGSDYIDLGAVEVGP